MITYQPRSAVRDVGKALGLSLDRVDQLAGALDYHSNQDRLQQGIREAGLDPQAPQVQHLLGLATQILGFPRHLSQHVGGFVITRGPLSELVPIENAAMPGRTFIEWDKDDLDTLGILKVDCLSLGMLTAIRKCLDLVARHHGVALTLATVPAEDPVVYDMICRADTVRGLPHTAWQAIQAAREHGPFGSIGDLARRARLSRALLARLAAADTIASLGLSRRVALWHVLAAGAEDLPLFAELPEEETAPPPLDGLSLEQEVTADYECTGLSLKAHPMHFVRAALDRLGVVTASALAGVRDRDWVHVAGLVLVRQRPSTAGGTVFLTLEDETGTANLVVWPRIWEHYRQAIRQAVALVAQGRVERSGGVIHLCASRLEDVSERLRGLASRSRDFH